MRRWSMAALLLLIGLVCFAPALAEYRIQVTEDQLNPTQGLDEAWLNVLLIGTDTRQDVQNAGRSDTMMVCSYHRETGEVKLTSLARDMWVNIPGGGTNKLNAAHSFGGPNLLMKTINETFQLNITQYVSVNFYGLRDIVDSLGGVDIELEAGEASTINRMVAQAYSGERIPSLTGGTIGMTHLSGAQALQYARIRYLDNDFGRTSRQRKLLGAMLNKVRQLTLIEQMSFARTCMEHVSTNISFIELIGIGMNVMNSGLSGFDQLSIPQTGDYHYDSADGTSKVIFDQDACIEAIHAFIYE